MAELRPENAPDSPAEPAIAGPSGHPLFPRAENETGPDLRRIDLIHVERLKEDGTWEACPRVFKAHELQSWKDVVDLFGGGVYRARAQCKKSYQWQGMTERKEFNGPPSRPFCEEAPKPKPAAPAPSTDAAPAAPPPPTGGFPHGPPGWAPPPGWSPPPAWAPTPGWTGMQPPAAAPAEPPAWIALLLKALDRPQAANDASLFAVMFKAQAEQNAVMLKAQADRDAMLLKLLVDRPATAPGGANPLEIVREIAPLLKNTTAPGQFMQGVEVAKSLMQQAAPAPAQEDFASTLANIVRTLNPQGLPGFPGASPAPSAPSAPVAPAPAAPPAAPVMNLEDVIRMAARDRNLARRFIEEMGRHARPANDTASPPGTFAASPVASSTPASPAPAAVASPAPQAAPAVPPAPASPAPQAAPAAPVAPAALASPAPQAAPASQNGAPISSTAPAAAPGRRSSSPGVTLRAASSLAAAPPDAPDTAPTSPVRAGGDTIGSLLAADQGDDEPSLSFGRLADEPEIQALMNAAGEDGRRALLMALMGAAAGPGAPTSDDGPPSA